MRYVSIAIASNVVYVESSQGIQIIGETDYFNRLHSPIARGSCMVGTGKFKFNWRDGLEMLKSPRVLSASPSNPHRAPSKTSELPIWKKVLG